MRHFLFCKISKFLRLLKTDWKLILKNPYFTQIFRCNGLLSCEFVVVSTLFGDSCPGTSKYLEARYSCVHVTTTGRLAWIFKMCYKRSDHIRSLSPTHEKHSSQPTCRCQQANRSNFFRWALNAHCFISRYWLLLDNCVRLAPYC